MKNTTIYRYIGLLLLAALPGLCDNAVESKSTIKRVTVYQDRALVERAAKGTLVPGRNIINISGLTARMDTKSLRAMVATDGVELLGVSWEKEVTKVIQNDKLSELEKKNEAIMVQIRELDDAISVIDAKSKLVNSYRDYARRVISEQSTKAEKDVDSDKWQKAVEFLEKAEADARTKRRGLETRRRKLQKDASTVRANLSRYMNPQSRASVIAHIALKAAKATTADVTLTYVTSGTGWTPRYDARINPADSKTTLQYLGVVRQSTGEDWGNVSLVLSTAKPHIGATPSRLKPLWINGVVSEGKRKPMAVMRNFAAEADFAPRNTVRPVAPTATATGRSSVENKGHAVTFAIKDSATIPSNGRPYQVTVHEMSVPGKLSYECIPKLRPFVYLKAETSNASDYPLLAGDVAIFRASGYIGTSKIAFTSPKGALNFFAGIDESLKVKRELRKQLNKDASLFSNKTKTTIWDITLKNSKAKPVVIVLKENVPISQMAEIKVKLLADTTYGYEHNEKTGIVSWKVELQPGETKTINLAYQIVDKL